MIYVENKRRKLERIEAQHPNAVILDITSKSQYAKILSPFYPHYNIPIPLDSHGLTATCVEAIWQGLKVFESEGVSFDTFKNDKMLNIKRTSRKLGKLKGHLNGAYGSELLGYFDARMMIYIPTYKWILENIPTVKDIIQKITQQSLKQDIVFLDYNTNIDFKNISSPMSHAGLVKLYIEGNYPNSEFEYIPYNQSKKKNKSSIMPSLFDDIDI